MASNNFVVALCLSVCIASSPRYQSNAAFFPYDIADIITSSLQHLQDIVDGFDQQLNHIQSDDNHPSCFEDEENHISTLRSNVESDLVTCVTDEIAHIEIIVGNIARQATNAVSIMQITINNVTACLQRKIFTPTCFEDTLDSAEVVFGDINVALRNDMLEAEEVVASAADHMSTCTANVLKKARGDAQQFVVDIALCIIYNSDQIEPSTDIDVPTEDPTGNIFGHSTEGYTELDF